MKKINKRLIVSDFDGTLLTSKQEVPSDVRNAIDSYVSSGGIFAVCTGRMLASILPRVRELGLKGIVVAYQGSVIAEIESGKIIKKDGLNYNGVFEICRFLESINQGINVYSDEVLYTDLPKSDECLKRYERITAIEAVSIEKPLSQYVLQNKLNCQKIACLVSPTERERLYARLSEKFAKNYDITCSAEVLVEVSNLGNNKGEALKFIAGYYSVPIESTVAIGDNLNDLSMIKTAAIGVAVGNATQALKDAADHVTVTNNEGAVAKIIEKYGFV